MGGIFMDQKGISKLVIVVIVVIVLAVAGVAAYWAMGSGGGDGGANGGAADNGGNGGVVENGGDGGEVDTDGDGGGNTVDVAGASSLQFKVSVTPAGEDSEEYTYMLKNAGTSSLMMRIEMESSDDNWVYIINGAQEKVWVYSDGEWMDLSVAFPTYWDTWNSAWQGYRTNLLDWTGVGDWSYTTPNGDTVRIYDITVNPSLADSLFQHS
jgi:flagellar basal body-associated protein FliL